MLQLKHNQAVFEVVDGPMKGRRYTHGVDYQDTDIPPTEKAKFGPVEKSQAPKAQEAKTPVANKAEESNK